MSPLVKVLDVSGPQTSCPTLLAQMPRCLPRSWQEVTRIVWLPCCLDWDLGSCREILSYKPRGGVGWGGEEDRIPKFSLQTKQSKPDDHLQKQRNSCLMRECYRAQGGWGGRCQLSDLVEYVVRLGYGAAWNFWNLLTVKSITLHCGAGCQWATPEASPGGWISATQASACLYIDILVLLGSFLCAVCVITLLC